MQSSSNGEGAEACDYHGVFLEGPPPPGVAASGVGNRRSAGRCAQECAQREKCRFWSFVTGWADNCYLRTRCERKKVFFFKNFYIFTFGTPFLLQSDRGRKPAARRHLRVSRGRPVPG